MSKIKYSLLLPLLFCLVNGQFIDIELRSRIENVQPMTGIVLWSDNTGYNNTNAIQLEFSYMLYNNVVKQQDVYDWTVVENLLNEIAGRKHQAVLRFRYVYVGMQTSVPDYFRALSSYEETRGTSEGQETWFPDWSHPELQRFHLDFYEKLAEKYDNDPRIAFIQTGFGLWAEYHIYDGPFILGKTFPSKEFQETNFRNMETHFTKTPWSVSIDAADDTYSPFQAKPELKQIAFGLFDDSFMCEDHAGYNASCWSFFGNERHTISPAGGEFSYYSDYDQEHVLDPQGIYGRSYETLASRFHITYMIGNDQPHYQTMARIKEAGMASGYKFAITSFKASQDSSIIQVKNNGIAPLYHDAYIAIDSVRASESLKLLQPGETKTYGVAKGGTNPVLTIACDRLVQGQKIEFDADLSGASIKPFTTNSIPKGFVIPSGSEMLHFSAQGRLVSVREWDKKGSFNVKDFPNGIYFLVIRSKGNFISAVRIVNLKQ
ncbi:MAG: T9SS type A sorting domain-containing protein [Chitinispirillaceae bacterium]|nr:T9SS type A sorting domain-containing protein [Chitinispirillaceae bacterium]